MEPYLAMGLFALYVVAASLVQHLSGQEVGSLTLVKRVWGRREGIALYFLIFVGVPLILGVVFLGRGIAHFDPSGPAPLYAPTHHNHALPHLYGRPLSSITFVDPSAISFTGEFPILLASSPQMPAPFTFSQDTESFRPVPLSFHMP